MEEVVIREDVVAAVMVITKMAGVTGKLELLQRNMGMTWLSPNFAILDCNAKTMTLAKPGTDPLVREGDYTSTIVRIVSFLRAKRMVSKGCLAFLAHLRDDTT